MLALRKYNPDKHALALMDALFTTEEMAVSVYRKSDRSNKPPLPEEKISLLEG